MARRTHNDRMQINRHEDSGSESGTDGLPLLAVPPAVIGFLLLLAVALACAFYLAAQLVHTP